MKWVTRARPKIDRIACPWLVTRFIDAEAEFLYVPADQVSKVARDTGAIPYDIPGVEYGHVGEQCSFDAFLRLHGLTDRRLGQNALVEIDADAGDGRTGGQCRRPWWGWVRGEAAQTREGEQKRASRHYLTPFSFRRRAPGVSPPTTRQPTERPR
jgi:hypothetical protein